MAVLYFFEKRKRGRDPRQIWQNVRICSTRVIAITRALAILFSPYLSIILYFIDQFFRHSRFSQLVHLFPFRKLCHGPSFTCDNVVSAVIPLTLICFLTL